VISERKKYIAKIFLNRCNNTHIMRQHLEFSLKLIESSYELSENVTSDLKKKYGIDNYIERLMPSLDEQFSIEEMQEAIKFFSSGVGKKMLDPVFLQKVGKIGNDMISQLEQDCAITNEGN